MRKSFTDGRRPSLSGAPLRVRQDNVPSHGSRPSSLERASCTSSKLPVSKRTSTSHSSQQYRPRQSSIGRANPPDYGRSTSSRSSFIPKTGRPSSGIGVRGRTDVPKDLRPISDKRYQSQCISSLLEFLTSHKYPHPISHKLLSSPSNKDFFNMFEFVMGHFWESYKLGPKMQEEVPSTLKLLGYPFSLPKTYLYSVGSPHTWPHLLAALNWMIELVQIQSSIAGRIDQLMFEPTDDDFDGIPDDKISFDYREKTFNAFMAGADTFDMENQELEKILFEKYHGGDIHEIIEENKRLEAMVEDAEKMEERITALKEDKKNQKQNEKRLQEYAEQLRRHKMALVAETEKNKDELAIIKSDLEKEDARLHAMQLAYENQELKPADVERLKADQDRLHAQMEQLEKHTADISADNWKVNMEQAKQNEKLDAEVAKYNRLAISLKLVPESAEFADGKDFRLHAGCGSDVVMDFETTVKPKMTLMKKNLNEQYRSKKKEHFSLMCDTEKMQELLNEKKERLMQKENELAQMESDIDLLKQTSSSEHKSVSEELRRLEQEVTQLGTSLTQAETDRDKLVEQYVITQNSLASAKEEALHEVSKMREMKDEMKARVEDHAHSVKRKLEAVLQQAEVEEREASERLARIQEASRRRRIKFGLPLNGL
ncbi:kinetochore protein ndc80 homolog [Plakobranchus ocellatus]|uniref:Kinetochore protein NDC80 n=1 Tax=Plakobranchus ocellatus TaxID=259542 RepID=A0AAV4D7Q8_9GAST|nr:kinetochore protein ndc80 homolog [Plakobranchus ocellatus]